MSDQATVVRETMLIVDGGADAELPDGSGGAILAGPQAVFVAGRVDADAPTRVRLATEEIDPRDLVLGYEGRLETPEFVVRVANVRGDELLTADVAGPRTKIRIFVTNLEEPDQILVVASDDPDAG